VNAIATAYCCCLACCADGDGLTAAGTRPVQGVTVAAPRSVPLGTRVFISWPGGGGWFRVEDRTSKKYDGRWDVYFNRHSDALKFGIKRNAVVKIYK